MSSPTRRALNLSGFAGGWYRYRDAEVEAHHPRAIHPVITHDTWSGDAALMVSEQQTDRILEWDADASEDTLQALFALLYRPDNVYEHQWREGDLVIWDNLALQHGRPELIREGERTLRRVSAVRTNASDQHAWTTVSRVRRGLRTDVTPRSGCRTSPYVRRSTASSKNGERGPPGNRTVTPPEWTGAMEIDKAIRTIAASQHGLIVRDQLRTASVSRSDLHYRLATGMLRRISPRVFAIAGSAETPAQRALAVVLDLGEEAALSHTSAAAWWQLPGYSLDPRHTTRLRQGRVRASHLSTVHQPILLTSSQVTTLHAVPVTTPVRTIFDLAARSTRCESNVLSTLRCPTD